jgi:hypothetical protein
MAYGTIKVDTITFTNDGVDKSIAISGLVQNPTFTGNVTVTGTISGNTVRGQTISGVTVTGTTANFTSGNFTNISGGTHTITSGVFASGTAANPSISFVSDPNTGIYSPGADQVAISTNGTGRLFVDASGNVGVGIASPTEALHIVGNYKGVNGSGQGVQIINSATPYIQALGASNINDLQIQAQTIQFQTGTSYSTTERMRLDSSGRLGLGTSSPNKPLHIYTGSSDSEVRLQTNSGTEQNAYLTLRNSGGNLDLYSVNGDIVLNPGNTAAAYFKASGRLGLGTSSPGALLEANGGDIWMVGANGRIYLQNGNTSGGAKIGVRGTSATSNGYLAFETNDVEFARFDSSGRLGIGTTSPGAALDVVGGSAANLNAPAVFIENNKFLTWKNTTGTWAAGASATSGNDFLLAAANNLTFGSGSSATERARIDSSGRLLVGTSTARANFFNSTIPALFQVETSGEGLATTSFTHNANSTTGAATVFAKSRGTTAGSATIVQNGDGIGNITFQGADGTEFVEAATISAQVDGTPGANDMPGRLVFSTTADGESSPTERMRISSAGNVGINATPSTSYRLLAKTSSAIESALGTQGVTGDTAIQSILVTKFDNDTTTAQNFIQFQVNNGGANCGRITANGANTAAFGSTSDIRLKENIEDLPPQLENILGLRPVEFDYIESEGGGHQIGFIAQEMQQIYPDVVNERGEDDMLMVTGWSKTEARLVKALQEAVAKIETLETKVAALEAQ